MECQSSATSGAAPASVAAADISALLLESVGQDSLVMKDQREVCRLSPRGDLATPIRSITDRPSLPPSSLTRRPFGFSCESLSRMGRRRAYHVPSLLRCGLGRASPPVVHQLCRRSS